MPVFLRHSAPRPLRQPAVVAFHILAAAVAASGDWAASRAASADATAMIQYNVHVSSSAGEGVESLDASAAGLDVDEASERALDSARATAAAGQAEFAKLSATFEAMTVQASCAVEASEVVDKYFELVAQMASLRHEIEGRLEASEACRGGAEPAQSALLEIKRDARSPAFGGAMEVLLDQGQTSTPGLFHQWHLGNFPEAFTLPWHEIADRAEERRSSGVPLSDLHQRRDCYGDEGVAQHVQRGPRVPTYSLQLHQGTDEGTRDLQLPVSGTPFGSMSGGSNSPFSSSGSSSSSSSSSSSDGSSVPDPLPGGVSSIGNTINGTRAHSKWDSIMRNGFKQMSHMMKPKDPISRRSWLLLLLFLALAIILVAAMLVVSAPLLTQGEMGGAGGRATLIQIALPYWLPTTPKSSGWQFVWLFAGLIVTSLSVNFWIGYFFLAVLKRTDPSIAKMVLKSHIFNSEPLHIVSVVGLFFTPLTFLALRKQLQGRWRQWSYLSIKVFLLFEGHILGIVGSYTMRMQMNNIAAMDADAFWHVTRTMQMALVAMGIVDAYMAGYIEQVLLLDWRRFLTEHVLDRYMGGHAYYKMNSNSGQDDGADNPDQRMQGDVDNFSTSLDTFVFSIIKTILTLISSTIIVWSIMPKMTMILLAYCTVGSMVSLIFTWKFAKLNYAIQKCEADYRYSMVHIRDNAEGIAFYGGENQGQGEVSGRFHQLLHTKYQLIILEMTFGCYIFFYTTMGDILPMIFLARSLFQGGIDFGAMGQVGMNFANVMNSLSFISRSANLMANLGTSTNRLSGLLNKIDSVQGGETIKLVTSTSGRVQITNLSVMTPDGRPLAHNLSINFGERGPARLLVVGRSGVGKSSLLRTLAGLWTQGSGEVVLPPKSECMFLPQKPYMPLGSLRKQLCYPGSGSPGMDSDLRSMLEELGLGDLPDRFEEGFDAVRDWTRVLSLGEQQRVAAVRAILHQPSMVVLDEATSALSIVDESLVYKRFTDLGMSYISVGHRMTIVKFHERILELLQDGGAWKLHTRDEYRIRLSEQSDAKEL